jgi:hypothetical protein
MRYPMIDAKTMIRAGNRAKRRNSDATHLLRYNLFHVDALTMFVITFIAIILCPGQARLYSDRTATRTM